ncbi:MAG TPA: chemotaxis protein CheW [Kofleriaceae bacterium]
MTIRSRAPEEVDEKARAILERRAERLRLPPEAAADEGTGEQHLAEFPVGDETYAIPLSAFRAVVPLRRVTPVPLTRPHIVGILRFQGQIVTALSMAALLGIKGWRQDPSVLLVVDPGWGRLVALDCEDVPRPVSIAHATLDEARAREAKAITEIAHDGRIVHLIDLMRLLDRRSGGRSVGG